MYAGYAFAISFCPSSIFPQPTRNNPSKRVLESLSRDMQSISIIIPKLGESNGIVALLESLAPLCASGGDIPADDGGSRDEPPDLARVDQPRRHRAPRSSGSDDRRSYSRTGRPSCVPARRHVSRGGNSDRASRAPPAVRKIPGGDPTFGSTDLSENRSVPTQSPSATNLRFPAFPPYLAAAMSRAATSADLATADARFCRTRGRTDQPVWTFAPDLCRSRNVE